MNADSKIEWTQATWNPLRGCTRVSEGCRHCYAEQIASRFSGPGQPYEGLATRGPARWTGKVRLVEEHLADPLRWRKPRRIFVNSMSDLFHESVPDEWIDRVFAVMAATPRHTYQVLTKRPERMRAYLADRRTSCIGYSGNPVVETRKHVAWRAGLIVEDGDMMVDSIIAGPWPLPNVWLGVSVEDQATADARVPLLLSTPAAVRFVSAEPLLGPIDFTQIKLPPFARPDPRDPTHADALFDHNGYTERLDQVIVGGESGHGARPCNVAWVRSIVQQCEAAAVPVFVKQLGARPEMFVSVRSADDGVGAWAAQATGGGVLTPLCLRDRKGGDPSEWPIDLRVRQFPGGAS